MLRTAFLLVLMFALAGCGSWFSRPAVSSSRAPTQETTSVTHASAAEVVLYALSLVDTGYRFGGKNPAAGLDCSGMVSYVFKQAAGVRMSGSAADIARLGRAVARSELRPGDLVFFNTAQRAYSHVGIYLGDARFIHAPSSNGRVRIDQMDSAYYAKRFEEARTYFD